MCRLESCMVFLVWLRLNDGQLTGGGYTEVNTLP
jgi:hypothetical protein